jgi:predicted TIM-barrel fold metal-dependent hydrolase
MTVVIDSDQHLYEPRTLWRDHIDPSAREDALAIEDDELGYPWVTWRGRRLQPADVQRPGATVAIGEWHERIRSGRRPAERYDDVLPRDYWDPAARAERLGEMGVDEAVTFPNFGLLWERTLDSSLPALTANMSAWNRWCATVVTDGRGRVHPVAHVTLRDRNWLRAELASLAKAGVRLAMLAPALVDGRALSHPDHDDAWAAFVEYGVTPVFHVADQRRPFGDGWYTEPDSAFVAPLDSVFLWTAAALAATDLILNGTFDRFPDLRIGIVELSAVWVPMYLMMLDGGYDFTARLNGRPITPLRKRPSDYFREHFRVSSFSYELPSRLIRQTGDVYMCCSDYPHSEGTSTPLDDYRSPARHGIAPADAPGLFHANVEYLLRRTD